MDKPYGVRLPQRPASRFNASTLGSPGFGIAVSGIAVIVAVASILTGHISATKPPVAESVAATAQAEAGAAYVPVDDNGAPNAFGARYTYSGRWQHVQSQYDGRSLGTSSRSFTPGASATLRYTGKDVNLYGVTGPNGGSATVNIDGTPRGTLHFYSQKKAANALLFRSGSLAPGKHVVEIVVTGPVDTTRRFVNIDGAIYAPASP